MATREISRDAQQNILLGWGHLSLGDVSTIQVGIQTGQMVLTIQASPHGNFWKQVVRLEWAVEQEIPPHLLSGAPDIACFQLTNEGRQKLKEFIEYRRLFDLSAWNLAPEDQKPPIVFVGRDQVFALLNSEKFPVNFVAMPSSSSFDQVAFAMAKQGRIVSRFDVK